MLKFPSNGVQEGAKALVKDQKESQSAEMLRHIQMQLQDLKQMQQATSEAVQNSISTGNERAAAARDVWIKNEAIIAADVQERLQAVADAFEEAKREGDALQKQKMLMECRLQQRSLRQSETTASEVAEKHGVAMKFLEDMQTQLKAMDSKLDDLQADVTAVREDLRRLTGRPVLKVIKEWSDGVLEKANDLQDGVYIEPEVVGPGSDGEFEPSDELNPKSRISGKEISLLDVFFSLVIWSIDCSRSTHTFS